MYLRKPSDEQVKVSSPNRKTIFFFLQSVFNIGSQIFLIYKRPEILIKYNFFYLVVSILNFFSRRFSIIYEESWKH